jgi:hypothetical protein
MSNIQLALNLIEEMQQISKDRIAIAASDVTAIPLLYPIYKLLTRDADGPNKSIDMMEAFKRWVASGAGKIAGTLVGALAGYGLSDHDLAVTVASAIAGGLTGSQMGHNLMADREYSKKKFSKADNLEK